MPVANQVANQIAMHWNAVDFAKKRAAAVEESQCGEIKKLLPDCDHLNENGQLALQRDPDNRNSYRCRFCREPLPAPVAETTRQSLELVRSA